MDLRPLCVSFLLSIVNETALKLLNCVNVILTFFSHNYRHLHGLVEIVLSEGGKKIPKEKVHNEMKKQKYALFV